MQLNVSWKKAGWLMIRRFSFPVIKSLQSKCIVTYYSFKTFPCFWLVKTTRIIHHKQLLLTKLGKNFVIVNQWRQNDVKSAAKLHYWTVYCKNYGTRLSCLVVRTKWQNCRGTCILLFHGEILSKNIARTARRQLDGVGVYLHTWADLPDKDTLWIIELTLKPL